MVGEVILPSEDWSADDWVQWLRRGPDDQVPHWTGLRDAADAIAAELARLRRREARYVAE